MPEVLEAPRTILLSVLDARVRLTTDSVELLALLGSRLGPFVREDEAGDEDPIEVRLAPPPARLRLGAQVRELSGQDPVEQAFSAIFREIVDRIETYLLVHAAAVADDSGAFLLAGSSGSGKTTLSLMLAQRGFRILSDDFTPLDRASGMAAPFPKALGVRRGAGSSAAHGAAGATITGVRGLLAHEGLPEQARARGPEPVAGIVFLDLDGAERLDPREPFVLAVRCAGAKAPVERRLLALDGIELLAERDDELTLRVDPRRTSSAALELALTELAPDTLEYGLVAPHPPRGDQTPRLREISASQAAILLLRELQNRRPTGRLLQGVGNDPTRLLPEIARLVSGLPLARIEPGAPGQTADLLASTFRSWADARSG
jgi:hypothetical protein